MSKVNEKCFFLLTLQVYDGFEHSSDNVNILKNLSS